MLRVFAAGDKVIVDLGGRRRDVLLGLIAAEDFAAALEQKAAVAELAPPELVRGEVWDVQCQSFDGKVALRFIPPVTGNATRCPMPPWAARKLADMVRFQRQQAAYKMRLVFN